MPKGFIRDSFKLAELLERYPSISERDLHILNMGLTGLMPAGPLLDLIQTRSYVGLETESIRQRFRLQPGSPYSYDGKNVTFLGEDVFQASLTTGYPPAYGDGSTLYVNPRIRCHGCLPCRSNVWEEGVGVRNFMQAGELVDPVAERIIFHDRCMSPSGAADFLLQAHDLAPHAAITYIGSSLPELGFDLDLIVSVRSFDPCRRKMLRDPPVIEGRYEYTIGYDPIETFEDLPSGTLLRLPSLLSPEQLALLDPGASRIEYWLEAIGAANLVSNPAGVYMFNGQSL